MRSSTAPVSRRRFLALVSGGFGALLAACTGIEGSGAPSAPASATAGSSVPSPTATLEPDLRTRIAQMLLVGFRGTTPDAAAGTIEDIAERGLGGVVLFSVDQPTGSQVRNVESSPQLAALTSALQLAAARSAAGVPLLIAIDQEGGRVARLGPDHGFPSTPSAAELGAADDVERTRQAGAEIGQTLRSVGINLNLAPVVDLDLNPDNPIIGALGRSFSADPAVVVRHASAFVDGSHQADVMTSLKHFPGHGSSLADTHLGVVDVTRTWQPVELDPYRALIGEGMADAVLTAHVFNATLDPDHPATLSRPIVTGILREQLGFDGLVLSDDMQMGAIRDAYGYDEAVVLAIEAGVDVLTIANQQVHEEGIVGRTLDIVEAAVADGRLPQTRIDESWRRIQRFKARIDYRRP